MNSTVQKLNSLVPLATNTANNVLNGTKNVINNSVARMNSVMNSGLGTITPTNVAGPAGGDWNSALLWFGGFLVIFLVLIGVYYEQFMESVQNLYQYVMSYINGPTPVPVSASVIDAPQVPVAPGAPPTDQPLKAPRPPQDNSGPSGATGMDAVVEKILPTGGPKEVFNVSKNDFTYYDAAPLCKALGAELATYDQVKAAWNKGADWCNYGWVKGQMAVYPTQKSTYEELQQGPEEQRGACGRPGLNGGHFDNPELKFGVSCYGVKPPQSDHDANAVTTGATRPLTASGLEFEKKVQRYQAEASNLGILPFSGEKWQSS
jgi:hypothetical protein